MEFNGTQGDFSYDFMGFSGIQLDKKKDALFNSVKHQGLTLFLVQLS